MGAEFEENLAVRYLWAALRAAGHRVSHVVFNAADETEHAARELAGSGADIAGFSMVFTTRAREFAYLATRARALGYRGHVVAGGHFAAFHAEELLSDVQAFDSVVCGEGEKTLCELASHPDDLAEIRGLVWRNGGQIVRNAAATKPPDLDALAIPPRKAPPDRYLGIPVANLLSSRGCVYACAFCSIAAWHLLCGGPRVRYRAPDMVAE